MKRSKRLLSVFLLIILIIVIISLIPRKATTSVAHSDTTDFSISNYSDRNITANARETDLNFSNLAFAPSKESYSQSQLATVLKSIKYFLRYFTASKPAPEYGTWLWTPTLAITPAYTKTILDEASQNHINAIYLSIDSYLDIFAMPDGATKVEKKKEFENILNNFIAEASKRGIAVDAEAGWRNWSEPGNEYKPLATISFVKEFNEKYNNKFRGFQYDIEPYLLDKYKTNAGSTLSNFISLVDKTETFLGDDKLRLSIVAPSFYDKRDGSTPLITYKGAEGSTLDHLLNILDRRSGSSIILMSYRNFAKGKDGSIEISTNEMNTARKGRYETEIILAQETGLASPSYITFYHKPKKYFTEETSQLASAFKSNLNFGGLAVHYVNALAELK